MSKSPSKFDLYSIYVDTIISNENKRQRASIAYLSLISAGFSLIGVIKSISFYYVILPMIAISIIWLLTLMYFRALAQAKFEVIKEIEKDWDFRPFNIEWEYFKSKKRYFSWIELSQLEMGLPIIAFIYSVFYIVLDHLN